MLVFRLPHLGHIPVVLLTFALLAGCGAAPGSTAAPAPLSFEAENAMLDGTPGRETLSLIPPGGQTNARVIEDAAARGGKAVGLFSTGSAVTFTLPETLATGQYTVQVRARGELYQGAPVLALRHNDQEVGRAELTSATYRISELGSAALQPGDRLSVVFLNDAYAGQADQDRNAVVDHLVLNRVRGGRPPAPAPSPAPQSPAGLRLPPSGRVAWDWQIGAGSDAGVALPAGVKLVSLDGFDISGAKVAQLNSQGVYTVCYINVGSYEPWRPDAAQYPAYLKIQQDPDWPDESFLDVNDVFRPNSVLATILANRFKMCRDKGFAAIEPDNLQNDENVSGGRVTTQQQIDFNGFIADLAHSYGLAVFQKNGPDKVLLRDRTGKMMVEKFDAILNEECQQYKECGPLAEYVKRGKLALNVEYRAGMALDCPLSNSLRINSIKKDLGLKGGNARGYVRQSCS